MEIRRFESKDELAVKELWNRCSLTRPWNDPSKDIARKLQVQTGWFLVGVLDEQVIATIMVGYDGHRGSVNYLAVDTNHRRKGLGNALMAEAERLLREIGCPKINLLVRRDNKEVIAFYEKLGFGQDAVVNLGKRLIADT
ncbi:MAG: GNAT family acetyltransferase [Aureliella sp.]